MDGGPNSDFLETKAAGQLRAGTAHILSSRSGVPAEDLHQYLYLLTERASPDQTSRQVDLVSILEAMVMARGLLYRSWGHKSSQLPEIYGHMCGGRQDLTADEGVTRTRAKLMLKLLFGETQPKTKSLVEEICLGSVDDEVLSMSSFEIFMKSVLLAKEAFDISGDIYDHLVLLKGSKVKVPLY